MDVITIDIETFYSKDYSLSKKDITTQSYIDDERFETIGLAYKVNNGPVEWVTGAHGDIKEKLDSLNFSENALLAHNALFDASILAWRYNIHPKLIIDTLSIARALHGMEVGGSLGALVKMYDIGEKGTEVVAAMGKRRHDFTEEELARYGEYCVNDVFLTYCLFQILFPKFNKSEISLIDMTIKMHTTPTLELDKDILEAHLADVRAKKEALLEQAGVARADLMSNDKLAEVLRGLGVEPPTKISLRTGKEAYAFAKSDEAFKALLEHDDPDVQAVVAARLGVKTTLEETRTERFLRIHESAGGLLPVPLKYYGAITGRWAACLVADTQVTVYDPVLGVVEKAIVDVLLDDLVWDGEDFVKHEGVIFNGYADVITWDGITGTEDHIVFTEAGEVSLYRAMQNQHRITIAGDVTENAVDRARELTGIYKN